MDQPHRDDSMDLTPEERQCALAIKDAVESAEEIESMSDFEYAYLAIACSGKSLEHILDIAYKKQCFLKLYKLNGTPEEGTSIVRGYAELQPGMLLDVSYLTLEQCYTVTGDMAAMQPDRVQTDAQWRTYLGGLYYIFQATTTDFRSIRNGIANMVECQGMGFSNFNYATTEREMAEFWSWFPLKIKEAFWFHAPTVASMMHSISKRIVGNERMACWTLMGGVDGYTGRLNELFNTPTPEIAQQNLLARVEMYLWHRYRNEQRFSLA